MPFSDYMETKVAGLFAGATYTAPATLYIALFTAAPSDTGGGTEVTTAGTAYARASVTSSTGMTVSGTNPTKVANVAAIDFATATANWGTVTHAAIFDAATGGNMLEYAALTVSKTITTGDLFRFAAGQLQITID